MLTNRIKFLIPDEDYNVPAIGEKLVKTSVEAVIAAKSRLRHDFSSSLSVRRYTLRGLHFQTPDQGQDKLVRCIRGRVLDVAVDLRRGSPAYGRHVAAELSAENGHRLFVPIGFAHGFLTLDPDSELSYKCSALHAPAHDGGIPWERRHRLANPRWYAARTVGQGPPATRARRFRQPVRL